MKLPAWLVEFHRQWHSARGRNLATCSRAFSREWHQLLDDSGITSAEDVKTAEREAAAFEAAGTLVLKRHRYRKYVIERVVLPLGSEAWLRGLFGTASGDELLLESIRIVEDYANRTHPLDPDRWLQWCRFIVREFQQGRNVRPFRWRSPVSVGDILELAYGLTSRHWADGTSIREASSEMKLGSKALERRRYVAEADLSSFSGTSVVLESIGLIEKESRVQFAGKITLHFDDGSAESITNLHSSYHLTSDLDRAIRISTPAKRVLMVENSKATLRRLAMLNAAGDTLLVACAFPTTGVRRLLELLPEGLPLYHFGDTDPSGFHILAKLRAVAPRPVIPFMMERRLDERLVPLLEHDRRLLPALISDPILEDVRETLLAIQASGNKGNFEQEGLGMPDLVDWPFYRSFLG